MEKKTTSSQRLLEAQSEIGAITKSQDNPYFKNKYADINVILAVVKPILNKHGLVLIQGLQLMEGKNGLNTTILNGDTGEIVVQSNCFLPDTVKAQETGSAITYFRRYAIQSLLALEAVDDDGANASGTVKKDNKTKYEEEPF